jgi:hypothetical protein
MKTWKENSLISIKLKDGNYTLAQLINAPYMVFFKLYKQREEEWNNVILTKSDILFCHAITRQFLKKTEHKIISSISPIEYFPSKEWIHAIRPIKKCLWEGTLHEKEVIVIGKERLLVQKDIQNNENNTHPSGLYEKVLSYNLTSNTYDKYRLTELTNIEVYPLLNERLFLCCQLNSYVDPMKDIIFDQNIPMEYQTYVNILSSKISLESLGY